jgi:hypothetical protein
MTGASRISGDSTHLSFKVPRNTSKANAVGIYYDRGSDTYTMKFWKQKGAPTFEMVLVEQFDGVYADMLRTLFTDVTGLETSLGTMGRRSNPVKSGKKTTSKNPSKRSSTRSAVVPNPRAKKPAKLSYVCIAPIEYSGSKYGIDERTPVTLKFSPREMKLAYKCYKLPAAIVQSKEFQEFANDHIVIYMSIAELKTMLRKFIK